MENKLTDAVIKNYKPKNKSYKVSDGKGLFLLINPNGSRLWRLKYRLKGKEKLLALGSYPEVSLANARRERDESRKLIFGNEPSDPMEVKRENIRKAEEEVKKRNLNRVQCFADQWLNKMESSWKPAHALKVRRSL